MSRRFKTYALSIAALVWSSSLHAETIGLIVVQPADQQEIVSLALPFAENEEFDPKLITISKKLLMATEKFEDAQVLWDPAARKINVSVIPKTFFSEIVWQGEVPEKGTIERLCVKEYEPQSISQERVSQITQCVLREVRGRGYLDATASLNVNGPTLTIVVDRGSVYKVAAVEIKGAEKIAQDQLLPYLNNKVGLPFYPNRIDEDSRKILKDYFDQGFYFAEVHRPVIQVDPETKKVQLIWAIREGHEMDIVFTGHYKSRQKLYDFYEREQTFPSWFLDQIVDEITTDMHGNGYLNAEIKVKKEVRPNGSEFIEINTRRRERFHLTAPEIIGSSNRKEVEKYYNSVSDFMPGSAFKEEEYRKQLKEDFVKLLISKGYLDARIKNIDVYVDKEKALAHPTIFMNEGDVFYIQDATVNGLPADVEDAQEVKDLKRVLNTDSPVDSIAIEKAQNDLARMLVETGHLDAKIDRKIERVQKGLRIQINVTSGPRYRVAKVLIKGAIKTDYGVMRREVLMKQGDFYEGELIRDTVSEILRLGIARSVDVQILEKDPQSGEVYVLVAVQESPRFTIEVGPGYGTLDGVRGVFKGTYANIGGTARKLTLFAKGSRKIESAHLPEPVSDYQKIEELPFVQRRVTVEYFEPSLIGLKVDGRLNYTHSKLEDDKFGRRNSFTAAIDYRSTRRWLFTTAYELAFSDPFNVPKEDDASSKRFTSIGEAIVADYLDDSFNPTKGSRTRLEGDLYSDRLGGEVNIWQAAIRHEHFFPLLVIKKGRTIGFAFGLGSEFSASYNSTNEVPIEKRYSLGGERTVRGYGQNGINPRLPNGEYKEGGESTFSFQTELSLPLFSSFELIGFFDGGNVFFTNSDWRPWDLRFGAGPGLRFNTPVGPIKAGWGFILNRRKDPPHIDEPIGHFYIDVGPL